MRAGSPRRCCCGVFKSSFVFVVASLVGRTAELGASPATSFGPIPLPLVDPGWSADMTAMTSSFVHGITAIPEPASCLLFGTGVSAVLAIRRLVRRRG